MFIIELRKSIYVREYKGMATSTHSQKQATRYPTHERANSVMQRVKRSGCAKCLSGSRVSEVSE